MAPRLSAPSRARASVSEKTSSSSLKATYSSTPRPSSRQSELDYTQFSLKINELVTTNQQGGNSLLTQTNIELWLKLTLISSALLSLVQLGAAIYLELRPVTLSIDVLDSNVGLLISHLPTLAAVTTQVIHIWVYAAIGLAGLWLWERRLARPEVSFDEIAAWGGLVSGQSSAVFYKSRKIGVVIAFVYFGALGLTLAASSAITSTVTLASTNQTVAGSYSLPSIATTNSTDPRPNTFDVINTRSVVFDAMSSVPQVNNLGWIQVGGAIVNNSDLGIANPGMLQSFIGNSSLRGKKFRNENSFVSASACVSGLVDGASCTPATTPVSVSTVGIFNNSPTANIITLNYINACGQPVTSHSLDTFDDGVPYASACISDNSNFLDWIATGSFAGSAVDAFPWNRSTLQFSCAVNLQPAAQKMRIYRRNGQVGVERIAGELCPAANLSVPMAAITSTLNDQVAVALRPATRDADFRRLVSRAGLTPTGAFAGSDRFAAVLNQVTGLAFRALYTALVTTAFSYDAEGIVLNYKGNDSVGVVTPTDETYTVAALGRHSGLLIGLLGLTAVAVVLSLGLLARRVGVFDPSDAAAVAKVAVTVAGGASSAGTANEVMKPAGKAKGAYLPL